jgi:hypothetical protein
MRESAIDPLERAAYHESGYVAAWCRFDRRRFAAKGELFLADSGNGRTTVTRSVYGRREAPIASEHWMSVMAMAGRAAEALRYPEFSREELVRLSGPDFHTLGPLTKTNAATRRTAAVISPHRSRFHCDDSAITLSLVSIS